MASFFELTNEQRATLNFRDVSRFRRASNNTDVVLQTPLMRVASMEQLHANRTPGDQLISPITGLPERYWSMVNDWVRVPHRIPPTIVINQGVLQLNDVTLHCWIASITNLFHDQLVQYLLVLFGSRGRAFEYIWHHFIGALGRPLRPHVTLLP